MPKIPDDVWVWDETVFSIPISDPCWDDEAEECVRELLRLRDSHIDHPEARDAILEAVHLIRDRVKARQA